MNILIINDGATADLELVERILKADVVLALDGWGDEFSVAKESPEVEVEFAA